MPGSPNEDEFRTLIERARKELEDQYAETETFPPGIITNITGDII